MTEALNNKKTLKDIEDITINADVIQEKVLTEILSSNAHVEYLKRHGLDGRTDKDTFKKVVPVVTYEDLKPDIDRIANGDKSPILCSKPIIEFLTSSGTSNGERKLIPNTEGELGRRSSINNSLLKAVMDQFDALNLDKGKCMYFFFIKSEAKTPGGLLAHPILTSVFKSSHFKDNFGKDPYFIPTSPIETILCLDYFQSMYSQLLCGLCQNEEVLRVGTIFASCFTRVIKFLKQHWDRLCNDIRTGTINTEVTDPSVRKSVMKILKPNPKLAAYIEAECKKDSWKGIITRLWPNTKYVDAIVTGSMSQYIPILDYYANGLPLVSTTYVSSECTFGINLNPFCEPSEVCYTIIPTMAYFEFSPVNETSGHVDSTSQPKQENLVDLVDVELGQEYELVVTTYAGLYRYQVGDILRVTGFKNKTPQFNFVCRKNVVLSIDSDKTNEVELQNAVQNGANHLVQFGVSLTEYTSYADVSTIPGHYVLYWEISGTCQTTIPVTIFEDCCTIVEESLNSVYRQGRVSKSIGPLEIKIVENGTFDKLMDFAVSLGASISQYKTPRCVKYAPIIQLLNSKTVFSYFSPKCPQWVPGHKSWSTVDLK